jgi:fumarate reductase subunit D
VKGLILRLEPVIWFLFGAGFFVGCLLFPAYLFAVGIAAPLGWIPADAIAFERVAGLAGSFPGRLVLLAMIVFPLWNGLNHLRHWVIDLSGDGHDGWVAPLAPLCYGGAAVLSLVAIAAVLRL